LKLLERQLSYWLTTNSNWVSNNQLSYWSTSTSLMRTTRGWLFGAFNLIPCSRQRAFTVSGRSLSVNFRGGAAAQEPYPHLLVSSFPSTTPHHLLTPSPMAMMILRPRRSTMTSHHPVSSLVLAFTYPSSSCCWMWLWFHLHQHQSAVWLYSISHDQRPLVL